MTDAMHPLELMLQQIEFYRNGDLSLGALVGDLVFLNESITTQSGLWERSLFDKIGDLEQVNAVMFDRNMEKLDETGRVIANKALNDLVLLANHVLLTFTQAICAAESTFVAD